MDDKPAVFRVAIKKIARKPFLHGLNHARRVVFFNMTPGHWPNRGVDARGGGPAPRDFFARYRNLCGITNKGGSARREFVGGSPPGEAKPERATGLAVSWRAVATESGYRTWIVARAGPPRADAGRGARREDIALSQRRGRPREIGRTNPIFRRGCAMLNSLVVNGWGDSAGPFEDADRTQTNPEIGVPDRGRRRAGGAWDFHGGGGFFWLEGRPWR